MINVNRILGKMIKMPKMSMGRIARDKYGRNMTYYPEGEAEPEISEEEKKYKRINRPKDSEPKRYKVKVNKSEKAYYRPGNYGGIYNAYAIKSSMREQYPNVTVVGNLVGRKKIDSDNENDYYDVIAYTKPRQRYVSREKELKRRMVSKL